jgi:methylmalonyl-CoA mutase cobalamin-binding subunit
MSTSSSPSVAVVVGLAESYRERFAEVVANLQAAGLTVARRLTALGQVTGTVPRERLAELERVPGVAYVELSGDYYAL